MSRRPVSIVILAWNAWGSTRACLESLRPTLGVRDQVVVVDNGSEDETAASLRHYPWVTVVTNPTNRGFAGGCNDGAAVATHDVIVFLNNDTVLSGKWIDPLVAALDEDDVAASGPRSNFVSGPQVVPAALYDDLQGMRRFAREWSQSHKGQSSPAARLVGFCMAVERSAFEAVGRFDEGYGRGGFEDDDLCQRLIKAGHRLVIRHDSFVHHDGHKTFDANGLDWYAEQESNRDRFFATHAAESDKPVLTSACLITKDEEANIGACLSSLQGLADEVVVYDTGSTDKTVQIARSLGAVVVEGFWDDDFSRARNAALQHCHGEWIIWVDADERLEVPEPRRLRQALVHTDAAVDAWTVAIHNEIGAGAGSSFVHRAARLFRRAGCEWTGRLHEQVVRRGSHAAIRQANFEDGRILHLGYLDEALKSRDKAQRNLRLAQAEVDRAEGWERGYSLTNLARSLILTEEWDEALARAQEALEQDSNQVTRRLALRTCAEATLGAGRPDEALQWCEQLRAESSSAQADAIEARVRLAMKDWTAALRLLELVRPGEIDDDGFALGAGTLAIQRAEALTNLGRHGAAADALIGALSEEGILDTHLGTVVELLQKAGRPLNQLGAALPAERAPVFLAQVLQLRPDVADQVLEACLQECGDPGPVLAASATLAKRLPVERAMVWSARLRGAGYPFACPLIAIATSPGFPVVRARAAATAVRAFADDRGRDAFVAAYREASAEEAGVISQETEMLCPELLASVADVVPGRLTVVRAGSDWMGAGL